MLNIFLFIIFPYICLSLMVLGLVMNIMFGGLRISAPATGFFREKETFLGDSAVAFRYTYHSFRSSDRSAFSGACASCGFIKRRFDAA